MISFSPFRRPVLLFLAGLLALAARPLKAGDIIELVNGDRYQGTVISMTASNLEFQSEIQGRLRLPRAKIATITLNAPATPRPTAKTATATNTPSLVMSGSNVVTAPWSQSDAMVKHMQRQGVDPMIVKQVQDEVLGGGSPEASQKFNDMMGGLMSGKLSVGDLRAEAQSSIAQIKDLKKDLGDDAGDLLDGYISILEKFVQESASPPAETPAAPASPSAPAPTAKPAVKN